MGLGFDPAAQAASAISTAKSYFSGNFPTAYWNTAACRKRLGTCQPGPTSRSDFPSRAA